ncbi:telomere length regulation protein-domain-containing protein [Lipomyces oligophaga]|uniref:telomere length regulation protein-domain-containing protein n=1 Tax=Lipomyces oligophaga TaxID=45792 RepID=UPI0034CD1416
MSNQEDTVEKLKNATSASQIRLILINLADKYDNSFSIPAPIVVTLINTTLPLYYDSLKHLSGDIDELLRKLLASVTGISSLVAACGNLSSRLQETPQDDALRLYLETIFRVLSIMLFPGLLKELFIQLPSDRTGSAYLQELNTIFGGSKLLTVLSEASSSLDITSSDSWSWIIDGEKYVGYLAREIIICGSTKAVPLDRLVRFLARVMKLGYPDFLFNEMMNRQNFNFFVTVINSFQPLEMMSFVKFFLKYVHKKYLIVSANENFKLRISSISRILIDTIPYNQDRIFFKYIQLSSGNLLLMRSYVLWLVSFDAQEQVFETTARLWGDKIFIKSEQTSRQEVLTQILLLLLSHLSQEFITRFAQSSVFLDGISHRLEAMSSPLRYMGMAFAQAVNSRDSSGVKLNFNEVKGFLEESDQWSRMLEICDELDELDDSKVLIWDCLEPEENLHKYQSDFHQLLPEATADHIELPESDSDNEESEDHDNEFPPFSIIDDGSDDSDDDPTLKRESIRVPVYMIDLIEYLNESDDTKAIRKHELALQFAAKIILRKASFGREIDITAKELALIIIGLKDNFALPDFEQRRLSAMVALIVTTPATVGPLYADLLTFGDYSLQERLVMLSAMALGALHLSGRSLYNFEITLADLFPSKLLPSNVHTRFSSRDVAMELAHYGSSYIEDSVKSIQSNATRETVNNALFLDPGVKFISSRLRRERQNQSLDSKQNVLARLAGPNFFLPLVASYKYFMKSIVRNSFGALLLSHYIKTLAIVLSCSYPSSPDIFDMSRELLVILSSIERNGAEPSVLEAVFTAVLVIMEVNDQDVLVDSFSRQLVDMKEYLEATWETIGDDQARNLAAGLLVKISELLAKWQRRLIGQGSIM